ncbi:hypothetical protein D3C75_1267350 [compost metagenome]
MLGFAVDSQQEGTGVDALVFGLVRSYGDRCKQLLLKLRILRLVLGQLIRAARQDRRFFLNE